jgi:hypothetical protein
MDALRMCILEKSALLAHSGVMPRCSIRPSSMKAA